MHQKRPWLAFSTEGGRVSIRVDKARMYVEASSFRVCGRKHRVSGQTIYSLELGGWTPLSLSFKPNTSGGEPSPRRAKGYYRDYRCGGIDEHKLITVEDTSLCLLCDHGHCIVRDHHDVALALIQPLVDKVMNDQRGVTDTAALAALEREARRLRSKADKALAGYALALSELAALEQRNDNELIRLRQLYGGARAHT